MPRLKRVYQPVRNPSTAIVRNPATKEITISAQIGVADNDLPRAGSNVSYTLHKNDIPWILAALSTLEEK